MNLSKNELAGMIDHTLLKPEASGTDVICLCQEALTFNFASVCVNPCFVPLAAKSLKGSPVKVCTVVGFPLGANDTYVKAYEAETALKKGADEIDMVLNIGALKDGDYSAVMEDILRVVDRAKATKPEAVVKVIIESAVLTFDEKVKACLIAKKAGADFVKTSTGFSIGGAAIEDIKLMRETVGESIGVKASGGIKSLADTIAMLEAGATRIGTSSGVIIMSEFQAESTA